MTAPDRAALVRLIRAELADCEPEAVRYEEKCRMFIMAPNHAPGGPYYPLTLVREQFWRAQAAAWRDFGRRLRDLLAEMGES